MSNLLNQMFGAAIWQNMYSNVAAGSAGFSSIFAHYRWGFSVNLMVFPPAPSTIPRLHSPVSHAMPPIAAAMVRRHAAPHAE
jgi:hypothetical protein